MNTFRNSRAACALPSLSIDTHIYIFPLSNSFFFRILMSTNRRNTSVNGPHITHGEMDPFKPWMFDFSTDRKIKTRRKQKQTNKRSKRKTKITFGNSVKRNSQFTSESHWSNHLRFIYYDGRIKSKWNYYYAHTVIYTSCIMPYLVVA